MIDEQTKKIALRRLKAIEGQVKGIEGMIENEKYCIDIINQVSAVRGALDKVGLIIMKRHIDSCVSEAIKSDRNDKIIEELMETIYKFVK